MQSSCKWKGGLAEGIRSTAQRIEEESDTTDTTRTLQVGPQNYLKSTVQDDVHLLDMQRVWCWGGSQGPGMLHQLRMLPDDDLHAANGQPLKNQLASRTPWLREKHLTSSKPKSTFESTCAWQSAVAEELSLVVGERFEEEGPSFRQQKAVW